MAHQSSRVILQFVDGTDQILNWESYSFNSDFLTSCDAFSMTVGDKSVSPEMISTLQKGGQKVQLILEDLDTSGNVTNAFPILTGYVDKVVEVNSRNGTYFNLIGRDILGQICDSGIDPWSNTYKLIEGQTLEDLLGLVFDRFGIVDFYLTDSANRQTTTGINKAFAKLQTKTTTIKSTENIATDAGAQVKATTKKVNFYSDPTNTFDFGAKFVKKLQPQVGQSFMDFVESNLERFGLHCWAMSNGSGVVVAKPDYLQEPMYFLNNTLNGTGNILIGGLEITHGNQPSLIIGKGFSGGGDFKNTRIKGAKVNEFIGYNLDNTIKPEVQKEINSFKGLVAFAPNNTLIQDFSKYFNPPPVPRVVYIEDETSKTQDQLDSFLRRKMSEYQRNAIKLHYKVQDHVQNGYPWKHNTIAIVNDEVQGIQSQPFWIINVNFNKSRSEGTTTDLILIPVGTLQFGP